MTFDLGALADRFRRATERAIVPPPTVPPAPAPPEDPGPWLTAEAHPEYPRITGHGGGVESNSRGPAPEAAGGGPPATGPPSLPGRAARPAPGGSSSRRRPRRRRWLPPASPSERQAEPVDQAAGPFPCPFCSEPHQPVPLRTGGGTFAPYARQIVSEPWETTERPRPLGLTATQQAALIRDGFHAWHVRSTGEPPSSTPLTARERIRALWYGSEVAP